MGRAVKAIGASHKAQIRGRREPPELRHPFRHHADLPLHVERRRAERLAKNLNRPRARFEQTGEHLDDGGFARPVRPQKAEELPGSYAERNIVHGSEFAEAPGETVGLNCGDSYVGQG